MDTIPVRPAIARPHRALLSKLEKRLALPAISPSWYHALGLGLSVLYLYVRTPWLNLLLVALILVADWLDGATARQYRSPSRGGYALDVVTDRTSEAFLFCAAAGTLVGQVFFALWLLNLVLAFYSIRTNRHTSLPLRAAFLVVLVIQML